MITEKQLRANRLNACKSTGPKTDEGKARSRVNALRHGLAGAGVALPDHDHERYERRLEKWSEELGPQNDLESYLVESVVLASVRIDRCKRSEFAAVEQKRRETIAAWEEEQEEFLQSILPQDPSHLREVLPQLQMFSTGCEFLMFQWELIRDAFAACGFLSAEELGGVLTMLGLEHANVTVTGTFEHQLASTNALARAGGDEAKRQLSETLDNELDRLRSLRDELWTETEAPLLGEVIDHTAVDVSPRAVLMRRYETACRNDLHRSLTQLARIRKGDLLHSQARKPALSPVPRPAQPAASATQTTPAPTPEPVLRNEAISVGSISGTYNIPATCVPRPSSQPIPSGRSSRRAEKARRRRQALEVAREVCDSSTVS